MDYLIPVIIISIILSLCMIITSIVILRNSRKTKHTPADTIKPIVEQLAAIHKDLDTIRRNSVNTERNIAPIKKRHQHYKCIPRHRLLSLTDTA